MIVYLELKRQEVHLGQIDQGDGSQKSVLELVEQVSSGNERFLIEQSGKPVAAIVSTEDLARLEEAPRPPRRGLLAAVGALADIEELDAILADISKQRRYAVDREVTLE